MLGEMIGEIPKKIKAFYLRYASLSAQEEPNLQRRSKKPPLTTELGEEWYAQRLMLPPRFDTKPPLVFVKPGGEIPIGTQTWLRRVHEALRGKPETSEIMKAIEFGSNARLYRELCAMVDEGSGDDEEKGYLELAVSSLFFGNTVADANIEGLIAEGGSSVKWQSATATWILDLDEFRRPESFLIIKRIEELQKSEFRLPTNKEELTGNANEQIKRIYEQKLDGTISAKAGLIAQTKDWGWGGPIYYLPTLARRNQKEGDALDVCYKMVDSLKMLQKDYIPRLQ